FFQAFEKDLNIIQHNSDDEDVDWVVHKCRQYLKKLLKIIKSNSPRQKLINKELGPIVEKGNIYFDPFNLTSHITDATDWRLYTPAVIVRPYKESQVAALIAAITKLDMKIIPRGAGTGLTGGAVPLSRRCVMVNTEKLNKIRGITYKETKDNKKFAVIEVEAGVITEDAIKYAKANNLVFATDPTSAWASTIGGNIAENAGGKTAVLWGTAIDNIFSYRIAMPDNSILNIERKDHPLRKIQPDDIVSFLIKDQNDNLINEISISGDEIRKKGLGKDVTNKYLKGLPGIQKEGCDGIITSAKFILHPEYNLKKTFCIEFFGDDMTEAGKVITAISYAFKEQKKEPALIALEHFDEEYIKAIDYKAKAAGTGNLKAVLLVDMVANQIDALNCGSEKLEKILQSYEHTQITTAKDDKEAERFWSDRKRLGAIAAHTNAFKLNEDIVIPIDALADFADYIDKYNLEEKRYNCKSIIKNIAAYLETAVPLEDIEWFGAKVTLSIDIAAKELNKIDAATRRIIEQETESNTFLTELLKIMRGYDLVTANIKRIHKESKARLIIIATHMHAGDGNVHVNIPLMSNDREMMQRASLTANNIMEKAIEFGGAVSGEHGIGITKIQHLPKQRLEEFLEYKAKIDPKRLMNPYKLTKASFLNTIYTPSFNILEFEAHILKYGDLESLATKIENCVKCGRCKASCPVFYPKKNLFFHPRNQNMAITYLIEALLYITQRTHSTKFHILKYLEEISDHCTTCHKCLSNCPVNIDLGEITIAAREILAENKFKKTPFITNLSLYYLASTDRLINSLSRFALVTIGNKIQRAGSKLLSLMPDVKSFKQKKWFLLLKAPAHKIPRAALYSSLRECESDQAILLEPEAKAQYTVFYFPGCGSERLFSDIGKASIYLLLKNSVRVILPPPFLCCGFPAKTNAKKDQFNRITLSDTIIFSQIKRMFNDLDFDACIISCGTCKESLKELDISSIFNCKTEDISKFILKINNNLSISNNCFYHAPCHDSLSGKGINILTKNNNIKVQPIPFCCSEAGTMAMSRPDISAAMLERKAYAIKSFVNHPETENKILTNCPSCIQGLGRNQSLGITPVHIAVELAKKCGGENFEAEFKELVKTARIIQF
ncbi:MAG: FAD-binding oxidoreductase, partial [Desulfobacteraceae bacterium]|nr:FAD-binding oxidoreductase [Desulfobacteraceae bacterium]